MKRPALRSTERELATIIQKSLPNVLKDEAEHTAEVIKIFLQSKGIAFDVGTNR